MFLRLLLIPLSLSSFVLATITLSIQDPVPIDTQVLLTWTRSPDDQQAFTIIDIPFDPNLPHDPFQSIGSDSGVTGQEHVNFGFAGGHHLQAVDPSGKVLATSNAFNVGNTPIATSQAPPSPKPVPGPTVGPNEPDTPATTNAPPPPPPPAAHSSDKPSSSDQTDTSNTTGSVSDAHTTDTASDHQSSPSPVGAINSISPSNSLSTLPTSVPSDAETSTASTSGATATSSGSTGATNNQSKLGIILGITISMLVLLILIGIGFLLLRRRRRLRDMEQRVRGYDMSEVNLATVESTNQAISLHQLSPGSDAMSEHSRLDVTEQSLFSPGEVTLPTLHTHSSHAEAADASSSPAHSDNSPFEPISRERFSTRTMSSAIQRADIQREHDRLREQMSRMMSTMEASNQAAQAEAAMLRQQVIWLSSQLEAMRDVEAEDLPDYYSEAPTPAPARRSFFEPDSVNTASMLKI